MSETMKVREGEELPVSKIQTFLNNDRTIGDILSYTQFQAGASNLTYALTTTTGEYVLRRPPFGKLAKKAHDMSREYQLLEMLHPLLNEVPKPILLCEDLSVIGVPFFIMERKKGIVLDTSFEGEYEETYGAIISEKVIDLLVKLHAIDYKQTNLASMTKAEGFLERQVLSWIARYEQAKTEEIEEVIALTKWLKNHIPETLDSTIIHYDFKLNNIMFNENYDEIVGLFDWEMTTVGDPLADVGVMLSYWVTEEDSDTLKYMLGKPPVTIMPGFYTREQMIARYAAKSGRDMSAISYYIVFAYFKLAVIGQQIYARFVNGQTKDPRFEAFGQLVHSLMHYANDLTKK
ncbi:phosphotransferase family protein [Kurthia senegalensis]|uniref:phosphotransferase family protein n=1 Tax=Kurthia senegalensis TaxID=1033740 RepID=UPI00028933D8|nr:phosphotransferase family protein [Kurthia senegalensis]